MGSLSDNPNHGSFITVLASPRDWRSTPDATLWASESSINNPCPAGFRLPSLAEWETERGSWNSNNRAGAFASPLKLVAAGSRHSSNGTLGYAGSVGVYWSATVGGSGSRHLYFGSGYADVSSYSRALGFSVRCLKD